MSRPDGGPAFPAPDYIVDSARVTEDAFQRMGATRGLSLRDYFAAKAMQAVIPLVSDDGKFLHGSEAESCAGEIARQAGMLADAMLAERNKP